MADSLEQISQQILNAIVDAVVITDAKKNIVDANDAVVKMFGYKPEEIRGASLLDLTVDDQTINEQYVKMLLSTDADDIKIGKTRGQRKDGSTFACDISVTEVQNGDSTFVVVFHDIDEADKSSAALQAQKKLVDDALKEADKLRQQAEAANRQLQSQKGELQRALQEAEQLRLQEAANKKQIEEINKQLQNQNAATQADLAKEQELRIKQQQAGTQSRFATYMIIMVCVFFLAPYLAGLLKVPESVIEIAKQATPLALGTLGIIAGALFNAQSQQQAMQRSSSVSSGLYNIQPAQGMQQMGYGQPATMQAPGYGQPGQMPGANPGQMASAPPPQARPPVTGGRG